MLPPELPEVPDPDLPLVRCRRQMCDKQCAYGLALGEDGCPICECRTPADLCNVSTNLVLLWLRVNSGIFF